MVGFSRTPMPPSRVSPGSRNMTPASSSASWMLVSVLARGSVAPRSKFFIATCEIPEAWARSVCVQPIRARAARIWSRVIIFQTIGALAEDDKHLRYVLYVFDPPDYLQSVLERRNMPCVLNGSRRAL